MDYTGLLPDLPPASGTQPTSSTATTQHHASFLGWVGISENATGKTRESAAFNMFIPFGCHFLRKETCAYKILWLQGNVSQLHLTGWKVLLLRQSEPVCESGSQKVSSKWGEALGTYTMQSPTPFTGERATSGLSLPWATLRLLIRRCRS